MIHRSGCNPKGVHGNGKFVNTGLQDLHGAVENKQLYAERETPNAERLTLNA
jgi:hypothetical protein